MFRNSIEVKINAIFFSKLANDNMEILINNAPDGEIEILELENFQFDSSKKYYLDKELFEEIKNDTGVKIIEGIELYSINLFLSKGEDELSFLIHYCTDEDATIDVNSPISPVIFDNDEKNNSITLKKYKG